MTIYYAYNSRRAVFIKDKEDCFLMEFLVDGECHLEADMPTLESAKRTGFNWLKKPDGFFWRVIDNDNNVSHEP